MSLLNMQILSFSQIKNESYFIYAVVGLILSVPTDRKKLNELDIHLMWSFLKTTRKSYIPQILLKMITHFIKY